MSDSGPAPADAATDACTFALLVEGEELSARYHVLSLEVSRELNRIPSALIELRDGDAALATFEASDTDHFIPGKRIEIRLGYRGDNQPVFSGIVVRHAIRLRKQGNQLTVECRDAAARMAAEPNTRHYAGKKDSDIIDEIVAAHGLARDIADSGAALEEVVQYNATDWDFILCRAEACGQVVLVEDGKVSMLRPAPGQEAVATLRYCATLLEFDADIDARRQSKSITATSWSAAEQELATAEATEPPSASSGNLAAADLAGVTGGDARLIRHGGALGQRELQAWADARLLRERLAKVRARARCQGFSAAKPGSVVALEGVGARFAGNLYVSGVRHWLTGGNWQTDLQLGLGPQLFAATFELRPMAAGGLLPPVAGLQVGVVSALEGDPSHEERIAVRLPFVANSTDGIWARIATLDAGPGRGTFFRPEVGDEVVVGFLDNDPRHPVILGMCHSSARSAPEAVDDDNHRKGYASRAKLRLLFDDGDNSILLDTPAGNRIVLSEDAKGIVLQDQNGNKITLDDSGISIDSAKALTLKAATDVKLEGANLDLKAQAGFKAAGNASAELSGASTTVKGSATVVIQGGIVQIN